jgi:hypothetical protein
MTVEMTTEMASENASAASLQHSTS